MVSPSKPNHSRVASQQQLHKCKLIKGPKPLTHFKFYLDIGKHHIESRIERLIKELGGSIEFFLAKDVTHFVTDKTYDRDGKPLNANSPSTPSAAYLSPAPLFLSQTLKTPSPAPKTSLLLLTNEITSSDEKATNSKPKSRADAMVQRARTAATSTIYQQQQSQHSAIIKSPIVDGQHVRCATSPNLSQNPVQLAQAWGTPIWSTEYTLKFLEKISLTVKVESQSKAGQHSHHSHHQHRGSSSHVKHFHGNYLKIEARQRVYRPYYQEFAHWPRLKLDCVTCPFEDYTSDKRKRQQQQQQKQRQQQQRRNQQQENEQQHPTVVLAATVETPKRNKIPTRSNSHIRKVNALSPIEPSTISILARNNINSIIESTMTRKTRNKPVRETVDACNIKTANDHEVKSNSDKCGYCEKCRVEYDVLSIHLQSKEHQNFVKNNDNYIAIDNLINSGTNVETFLRLNNGPIGAEAEKNGLHSPKRLNNYLNHHSSIEDIAGGGDADGDDTAGVKSPKQINGVHHHHHHHHHNDEDVSPSKLSKLPKYSPPITRRSQSKNSSQLNLAADDADNQATNNEDEDPSPETETNISNKSPSTKTMNGKKKCDEPKPNETKPVIIDDSPVPEKRLVRAFPRYKVIGDGEETIPNRLEKSPKQYAGPRKSPTKSATTKSTPTKRRKAAETAATDKNKDLVVKFKRVRESELSKLTVEADNFMFPKPREDVLTDDDRQSSSERDGDQSSEILSSEIGSSINDSLNSSHPSNLNESTVDNRPAKCGGRRKKRVSQTDAFKSPAEPKQKFRPSLIQPRLNFTKQSPASTSTAPSASGVQANVKPTRRNASASVARAVALTKATKRKSRKQTKSAESTPEVSPTAVDKPIASTSDEALEDGMGENIYDGGKLLENDYFKSLLFSFQRTPTSEPWFETFSRQDEHRERVFEYWGNTVYRKLPYEMGPLPPLQANCCMISKLAEYKASKRKTKRGMNRMKEQQINNASTTNDDTAAHTDDESGLDAPCCSGSLTTRATKPKTNVNSVSSTNSILSSSDIIASTLAAVCSGDDEDKDDAATLSQLLLGDSITLPGTSLMSKKKGLLLDAFGKPRKSPREHASTLAILSSLVQQRRRRIKELNGGISPEKMPNYRAAVAAAIAAHQSSAENSGIDDEFNDDFDDAYGTGETLTSSSPPPPPVAAIKPSPEPNVICSPTTRRRSNQTPVFEMCKSPTTPSENGLRHSSVEPSDKVFRLRNVKRRQTDSLSSTAESTVDKIDGKGDKDDKAAKHIEYPKMPVNDYVDPIKLEQEMDLFFADERYSMYDVDVDINVDDTTSDLIADGAQNNLEVLLSTLKPGPLSYRTLQRTKKRHINKTGWPSLPRKRQPKREKVEEVTQTDEDGQPSVTNDDEPERLSDIDEEDLSAAKSPALNERQDIRSPFCDDNAVPFAMFASSSEKAENSDIFTVSSDSYLDTDMNDTVSKSRSTPINHPMAKQRADSQNTDDDAELSDGTASANDERSREACPTSSAAESVPEPVTSPRPQSILERALMATRSKIVRSPIIIKEAIQSAINMKLQPLVCVQKMSDKDLPLTWLTPQESTSNETANPLTLVGCSTASSLATVCETVAGTSAPASTDGDDDLEEEEEEESTQASNNQTSSPRTKTSPRKLRKPRGRWYRER